MNTSTRRILAGAGAVAMAVTIGLAGTAAAASGFVSDDFHDPTLQSRWEVVRPKGVGSVELQGSGTSDARLALSVPAGTNHDPWTSHDGVRAVQPVTDTDLHVEARFESIPSQRYQMQGLSFEHNSATFARFEVFHNGSELRLYASTTLAGAPKTRISKVLPALSEVYLRVQRAGSTWTLSWSGDGTSWTTGGSFTQTLTVAKAGPYVGSYDSGGNPPGHTALVDYVFDVGSPISPEDADTGSTSPTASPTGEPSPTDSSCASPTSSPTASPTSSSGTGPVVDAWHGNSQTFGSPAQGQKWANVVGRVTDPDGVASLFYRLNGGPAQALSIGPDKRRLQNPGDFNADIAYANLVPGDNIVTITATDNTGAVTTRTVTVTRSDTATPGLPYSVSWTAGKPLAGHVVDGRWAVESGGLRTKAVGYDRIVAVGDIGWQDYEVTVPGTVHSIGPGHGTPLSGAALFGLGVRWQGHTAVDSSQPAYGWYPTGAFAWYRFYDTGARFVLSGNDGSPSRSATPGYTMGATYMFKVRVQTVTSGTRYSVKFWPANTAEPTSWLGTIDEDNGPAKGSVVLIAHHVDATFGAVTVNPV